MYVPSSSCLKTILVGISIIGVMLSNGKGSLVDVLVTAGNRIDSLLSKSSCIGICASMTINNWNTCL